MSDVTKKSLAETKWFCTLCAVFEQSGLDSAELFEQAGLSPAADADMATETLCEGLSRAWEMAVRRSGNPALGLRSQHPLSQLEVLSHALLSAPTVRHVLTLASRYVHLFWPMASMGMDDDAHRCLVTLSIAGDPHRMPAEMYDFFACMVLDALRLVTAAAPEAMAVHRPGPKPSDPRAWLEVFGCPVHFGRPVCSIELAPAYVAQAIPTANAAVYEMSVYLAEQMAARQGSTLAARIRAMLPECLARGEVRRAAIAQSMGMSERTLCRRLSAEGTNFADVVDELRREAAQRYFQQGHASPTQIAYSLGFADPSNFYRACKRWFGSTPGLLRSLN